MIETKMSYYSERN